jgi:hypothetical protein
LRQTGVRGGVPRFALRVLTERKKRPVDVEEQQRAFRTIGHAAWKALRDVGASAYSVAIESITREGTSPSRSTGFEHCSGGQPVGRRSG